MNKTKMGTFIRELRSEKNLSQPRLADAFAEAHFEVSTNAISSWENGKTIPDIDKLQFLADFFGVTVDDILDGEKYEVTDFDSIYHIHQDSYFADKRFSSKLSKEDPTTNPIYYEITKEGEIIRKRFKKHILDYINECISRKNLDELIFFLKNYYILNEDFNITTYLAWLRQLKNKKVSNDEKWWEAQRYICPIEHLTLTFSNLSDEGFLLPTIQKRMNYSEPWEKDALLTMIQIKNPIVFDPSTSSSKSVEKYEKEHGKPFNVEQITKNTIRYLIENGAMINRNFLSFPKGEAHIVRVIDTLEKAHNALVKPLSICVQEGGKAKFYYVENNKRNRFFIKYDYYLVRPLRSIGYTYDEIFNIVDNNQEVPDEVYLRFANNVGLDTNREVKYIKADLAFNSDVFSVNKYWPQYYEEEHINNTSKKDDLEIFEEELSKGIYTNTNIQFNLEGGITESEKYNYIINKKTNMSYEDFEKNRLINRTKKLLESLDSLSMEQIRKKFFQLGGKEND